MQTVVAVAPILPASTIANSGLLLLFQHASVEMCVCVCVRCVRLYLCVFVCQASGVYRCVWMSKQNFEAELQPELKNFKNFQRIPLIFQKFSKDF